jgi:hypothetical protein
MVSLKTVKNLDFSTFLPARFWRLNHLLINFLEFLHGFNEEVGLPQKKKNGKI